MSGVEQGHFTLTSELQAAAMTCIVSRLLLSHTDIVETAIAESRESDPRFPIVANVVLGHVLKQLDEMMNRRPGAP